MDTNKGVILVREITRERPKSTKSPIEDLLDLTLELYRFAADAGWSGEPDELDADEVIEAAKDFILKNRKP